MDFRKNKHPLTIKLYMYGYPQEQRETYPVYARIIYKRDKSDISVRVNVKPDDWNTELEMLRPNTKFNRYTNTKLDEVRGRLQDIFDNLAFEEQEPSVKMIRSIFRGENTIQKSMKLIDYYDQYVAECKERPAEYGEGVLEHYAKTRRHMLNYMASKGIVNITLKQLSRDFIMGFEHHLLSTNIVGKSHPMNRNTATTYLRKLKTAINKAVNREILDKNPFAEFKMVKYKSPNITYLTNEELERFKIQDLAGNESLIRVRDLFLFSVYTGLRWSDAINLKQESISTDKKGTHWIFLKQIKTRDEMRVPMIGKAVSIYKKYKDKVHDGYVLPRLSSQKVNTYIKLIANMADIKKKITHHSARHTFATVIGLENGVDLKTVSKLLGHHSIKSTEIYAKVSDRNLVETAKRLDGVL